MGRKRLNASAGTGKKIMDNLSLFSYTVKEINDSHYVFNVSFDGTDGICSIRIGTNNIIERMILNMDNFDKSLVEYNDPTLIQVGEMMMRNI